MGQGWGRKTKLTALMSGYNNVLSNNRIEEKEAGMDTEMYTEMVQMRQCSRLL